MSVIANNLIAGTATSPLTWDYPTLIAACDEAALRPYFARSKDIDEEEKNKHPDFIAARNQLLLLNKKNITYVGRHYFKQLPMRSLSPEDYENNGWLGALDAATRYDGSTAFLTFCLPRVSGEIKDALRRENFDGSRLNGSPEDRRKGLFRAQSRNTGGELVSLAQPQYGNGQGGDNRLVAFGDTLSDPLSDERATRTQESEEWAEVWHLLTQVLTQLPARDAQIFLSHLSGKTMKLVGEEIGISPSRVSQIIGLLPDSMKPALERIVWGKPHSFAVIDETKYAAQQDLWLFRGYVPVGPFKVTVYGVSPDRLCAKSVDIGIDSKVVCLPISPKDFEKGIFTNQSFIPSPFNPSLSAKDFKITPCVNPEDALSTIPSAESSTPSVAFSAQSLFSVLDPSKQVYAQIVAAMIEEPQTPIATIMQHRSMIPTEPLKVNILRCVMPDAHTATALRIDDPDFRAQLKSAAIEFYTRVSANTPPTTTPPPPPMPLPRAQPPAAPASHAPSAVAPASGPTTPPEINKWIKSKLPGRSTK